MPFTPAHTAVVLPFLGIRKSWMSGTALVLGSMIPDFEYFIFFGPNDRYGHKISGIFYFDVPLVILVAFLFHGVVKKNLLGNIPRFLRSRFQELYDYDFVEYFKQHYAVFIALSIVGILSHFVLDAFTHAHGFFVRDNVMLLKGIYKFQGAKYPYYYVAQYVASYAGMLAILVYVVMRKPVPVFSNPVWQMFLYWFLVGGVVCLVLIVRVQIFGDWRLENLVIDSLSGLLYGLIAGGLIRFPAQVKGASNSMRHG
jgi:hypothetical protein